MEIKITPEIKSKVPKDTPYCYIPKSTFKKFDDGKWGYEIESCPYYKSVDGLEGHCSLYDCEVMDQVKECGINVDY